MIRFRCVDRARRLWLVLGCVGIVVATVTGCVPGERAADGKALEAALRALPSVEAASVTNFVRQSTYRLLEVKVRIRDATTSEELRAIQDVYSQRVAGRPRSGQSVAPLSIEWCESRAPSPGSTCGCPSGSDVDPFRVPGVCSSLRSEPGVQVPNEQWLRLRHTDPIDHVQMAVSPSKRTIEVEAAPYKLGQTVPLITPTPAASITSLPVDMDRILARLVYNDPTSLAGTLGNTYYGLPQLLHKIRDISKAGMYRDAGVDLVAEGATVLYRTRDEAAAKTLAARLATPSANETQAASPTNLPQATCISRPSLKNYFCTVATGRWMATAGADSLLSAQQAISAQYTILATNP